MAKKATKKAAKKAAPKKPAITKQPTLPKLAQWRVAGDKTVDLNKNIRVSNDGREGTIIINEALAAKLIADGKGHFLERVEL